MGRMAVLMLAALATVAGCGSPSPARSTRAAAGAVGGPSSTEVGVVPTSGALTPTTASPATAGSSGGITPSATVTAAPAPPGATSPPPPPPPPPTTPPTAAPTTGAPTTAPPGSAPGAYGLVTASPSCPVQRQGQSCPPNPVSGARVDAQAGDGHVVASAQTSANGGYTLVVAPGRYTLVVNTGAAYPRCPATPVTVASGAATRADINCDSGIR